MVIYDQQLSWEICSNILVLVLYRAKMISKHPKSIKKMFRHIVKG